MSGIAVSKGSVAIITITNDEIVNEIHGMIEKWGRRPAVAFRPDKNQIALVFSEDGEITIDVTEFMADLQSVDGDGGSFYVYAADPVPVNPPQPDALCPCG